MARRRINKCEKCGGEGWLWWNELEEYSGPAHETGEDDTRYTCDACHAEPINEILMESFDASI